jgi:RimJ/RimL family protein N-acetyltransferase
MKNVRVPPPLTIRRVIEADSELLFLWRNDPATRAASLSTAEVTHAEHERWFRASLADPLRRLFLLLLDAPSPDAVAVCRFDLVEATAEVSINLNPRYRGLGLSGAVLAGAIAAFRAEGRPDVMLTATIRVDNESSIRLFERAGFRPAESANGVTHYELPSERA